MLKKEILSVLKSKRVLIIALIIFLIPIMDINMAAKQLQVSYKRAHKEEILEADRALLLPWTEQHAGGQMAGLPGI